MGPVNTPPDDDGDDGSLHWKVTTLFKMVRRLERDLALIGETLTEIVRQDTGLLTVAATVATLGGDIGGLADKRFLNMTDAEIDAFIATRLDRVVTAIAAAQVASDQAAAYERTLLANERSRLTTTLDRFAEKSDRAAEHDQLRKARNRSRLVGAAVGVGLWIGLSGPLARVLPQSWQAPERLAAATLVQDRWTAGETLLQGADRDRWRRLVELRALDQASDLTLDACRGMAWRLSTPLPCAVQGTVLITPPRVMAADAAKRRRPPKPGLPGAEDSKSARAPASPASIPVAVTQDVLRDDHAGPGE